MSATIKPVSGESLAIVTYQEPFNPVEDLAYVQDELEHLLAQTGAPLQVVVDLRQIDLDFSELVQSLGMTSSSSSAASSKSGQIRLTFVGDSEMVKMAADAYGQAQYGGAEVDMFASLDQALAHARR